MACDKPRHHRDAVPAAEPPEEFAMIKVHIFYPNAPGVRFDMAYYVDRHMPMVQARIGAAWHRFHG